MQYHSEFGYFVPAMSLRRKASLVGTGVLFGAMLGGLAAVVMLSARQGPISLFSMQRSQAAPTETLQGTPVPHVASSLAVPAAVRAPAPVVATARTGTPVAPTPLVTNAAPAATTPAAELPVRAVEATAPAQQRTKRKQRKIARQPPRYRIAVEDDPRRAYAAPLPRFGEPYGGWGERRPYRYGW